MVVPIARLVEESKYSKDSATFGVAEHSLHASFSFFFFFFLFFFVLLFFHACRQCLRATCQKLRLSSLIGRNTAGLIIQPEAESKLKELEKTKNKK